MHRAIAVAVCVLALPAAASAAAVGVLPLPIPPVAPSAVAGDYHDLLNLLKDPDPAVRIAALRLLRYDVRNSDARDAVLSVLRDGGELPSVRKQAAKSLADAGASPNAADALLEVGDQGPLEVRVMCFKALYWAAAYRSDVRERLLDRFKNGEPVQIRKAAAWGLFASVGADVGVRSALLDTVRDGYADAGVRLESLKSLYGAMNLAEVRAAALEAAKDSGTVLELRAGAIMALSASLFDPDIREFLGDTARRSDLPAVRQVALTALQGPTPEMMAYFHQGYRTWPNGSYVDPLDRE